jgi:poly(3-hydroxyoctanoate) depolymerase
VVIWNLRQSPWITVPHASIGASVPAVLEDDQTQMSATMDSQTGRARFVEVDGVRIRVAVRGAGPPLLLIMGLGGNLEMWEPFQRALGPGIETIAFDAPGVGSSTGWSRPRRMGGLARAVDRMVAALGYGAVDVLGVSLGGALAQELAKQRPERIRRLVLAATAPGVPGLGGVPGNPRAMLTLATPRRYHDEEYFRRVAPTLYGGASRRDGGLIEQQAHARLGNPPTWRGYAAQLYAIQGWTMLPWLRLLHHDTLVLAGDDDPIVPLVNGKILARLLPNATLHVVRGGGHLFLLEQAEESAAAVRAFLDG